METCIDEKKKFEECFKEWLNNGFTTGNFGNPCVNEWKIYEKCINKELEEKNLLGLKSFTTFDLSGDKLTIEKNMADKQNGTITENSKK
ncbi:uncharacterized protein cubi_01921 [Cryptosporidium ubiquitum]|uniref:Uncharacterized protein n=1 Tax=Cryptosporidium ubiquitum TaxID=857276 RepID=A0A1J4MMI0_9CRYT|nr:uncharacterized protein cubi_01921 [Cryptosporidium ubiquitum]OII75400.1 hypothetical protein cubi_01921 [Cryptosporidium ubiquitum]